MPTDPKDLTPEELRALSGSNPNYFRELRDEAVALSDQYRGPVHERDTWSDRGSGFTASRYIAVVAEYASDQSLAFEARTLLPQYQLALVGKEFVEAAEKSTRRVPRPARGRAHADMLAALGTAFQRAASQYATRENTFRNLAAQFHAAASVVTDDPAESRRELAAAVDSLVPPWPREEPHTPEMMEGSRKLVKAYARLAKLTPVGMSLVSYEPGPLDVVKHTIQYWKRRFARSSARSSSDERGHPTNGLHRRPPTQPF